MATPLSTITGTANKIDVATLGGSPGVGPVNGKVTISLDSNINITNSISCVSMQAYDLDITSAFTNPWPTNPGTNGFALKNDGSGSGGTLSWSSPPVNYSTVWNTTGPDLQFQYSNNTISAFTTITPPIFFKTSNGTFTGSTPTAGNVVYLNFPLSSLNSVTTTGVLNISLFTTWGVPVNLANSLPAQFIPSDFSASGDFYYLGTLPILNIDTGVIYNAIVGLIQIDAALLGTFEYNLVILPGGASGGAQASDFGLANTHGFAFGYDTSGTAGTAGTTNLQSATFVYSI